MSIENPTIESAPIDPERKVKEERLDGIRSRLESVTDAVGKPIDSGIKETVALFNAVGLPTQQSCEGHADAEEGRPYPWVAIGDSNEPEERYVSQRESFEKAAQEYNVPLDDLVKKFEPNDVWNEIMDEVMPRGETAEYREWRERNQALYEYAGRLLDDFYRERTANAAVRLMRVLGAGDEFEIHSQEGGEQALVFDELPEAGRQDIIAKLPERQKEMAEFTEFLKNHYFSKEFDISSVKE